MTPKPHKFLAPACMGMELCWLGAWANFLVVSTAQIPFPLVRSWLAFVMAWGVAGFFKTRNYRFIWMGLGHILGLGLMIGAALVEGNGWHVPDSVLEWVQKILICFLVSVFWYRGAKLSVRKLSYGTVCNHFDLGISLFFALVLIKLLVFHQSGIQFQESHTVYSMGAYFFFGLMVIFLSHNPPGQEKQFIQGFRIYGTLISVALVLMMGGLGLWLVLVPWMTSIAESGYLVLKQAAIPLTPYLVSFLRFVLSGPRVSRNTGSTMESQGIPGSGTMQGQDPDGGFLPLVITLFLVLFLLICTGMICYGGYRLFKLLLQRHGAASEPSTNMFLNIFPWLVQWVTHLKTMLFAPKNNSAEKGFARLVAWGRKSGISRPLNQTPAEYGQRLGKEFFCLENEIQTIVQGFHQEAYGEMPLDPAQVDQMGTALKKIHHPRFWSLRFKSLWKRG